MNNRRSFLGGLFKGIIAAAVAPQIVTHGLGLVVPKRDIWIPNPAWVNAPYEIEFYASLPFYLAKIQLNPEREFRAKAWADFTKYLDSETPLIFKGPPGGKTSLHNMKQALEELY